MVSGNPKSTSFQITLNPKLKENIQTRFAETLKSLNF